MLEFRHPFPVETPLGQGYALYVVHAGMWENDAWCVALDDGQLLHFTTNQLRYVGNGSYDMKKPRPLQVAEPPAELPHFLHERLAGEGFEGQAMTACGLRAAPFSGLGFTVLPGGGRITLTTDATAGMCARCHRVTARPGYAPVSPSYEPLQGFARK